MEFVIFDKSDTESLNKFLRGHRILSISKMFNQIDGCWSFCVEYVQDENYQKNNEKHYGKIDYREKLTPEDFAQFRALRDMRNAISAELNTPPFVILLNSDLEHLIGKDITEETLIGIDGFGQKKFEKYGKRLIELWPKYKQLIPGYIEQEKEFAAKKNKSM